MSNYIFIESRDPFASGDSKFVEHIAVTVKERNHSVTVFLVQNGVLGARKTVRHFKQLLSSGVKLMADDLSLAERGINIEELAPGITKSSIQELVQAMVQKDTKAIWH